MKPSRNPPINTGEKGYITIFDYATIDFDMKIKLIRPASDNGDLEGQVGDFPFFIDHLIGSICQWL